MDIGAIKDAIKELEKDEATFDNVAELSYLYIVRNNLSSAEDEVEKELNDVIPTYQKFVDTKRKYQMKEVGEDNLLSALGVVCLEIQEFIQTLYSNTDSDMQRQQILNMITYLYNRHK